MIILQKKKDQKGNTITTIASRNFKKYIDGSIDGINSSLELNQDDQVYTDNISEIHHATDPINGEISLLN